MGVTGIYGEQLGDAVEASFTTRDAQWQTAEQIDADPGGVATPDVAMDASGNAMAVWRVGLKVVASRYTAGGGWDTPTLISVDNGLTAAEPRVAMDASGNAIVVWLQQPAADEQAGVWANSYRAGVGWGTPTQLDSDVNVAFHPQIAMDPDGNALAIWRQWDGAHYNLWASRYTPDTGGTGWGTATVIETNTGDVRANPRIAMDSNGNALAVWSQLRADGGGNDIWANRYTPGAGWGTATLVEMNDAGDAVEPQIAVDGSGNAMAVWAHSGAAGVELWANRYTIAGGWGTPTFVAPEIAVPPPRVAVDATGNAVVVMWAGTDVLANRFKPGTGWGTASPIDSADTTINALEIAMDASGSVMAVWAQSDGTSLNVWASSFD